MLCLPSTPLLPAVDISGGMVGAGINVGTNTCGTCLYVRCIAGGPHCEAIACPATSSSHLPVAGLWLLPACEI